MPPECINLRLNELPALLERQFRETTLCQEGIKACHVEFPYQVIETNTSHFIEVRMTQLIRKVGLLWRWWGVSCPQIKFAAEISIHPKNKKIEDVVRSFFLNLSEENAGEFNAFHFQFKSE